MGANAGGQSSNCNNLAQPANTTGMLPPGGCPLASTPCPDGNSGPFPIPPGRQRPAESNDAIGRPANQGGQTNQDQCCGSGSTIVTADVYEPSNNVTGMFTVGGRQVLKVQNGALDL